MPLPAGYVGLYNILARKARELGYAMALHGSLKKDMDLMCMPWTEEAVAPEELVRQLCESITFLKVDAMMDQQFHDNPPTFPRSRIDGPEVKPHGRLAWNIQLGGGCFLDVSVMPLKVQETTSLTGYGVVSYLGVDGTPQGSIVHDGKLVFEDIDRDLAWAIAERLNMEIAKQHSLPPRKLHEYPLVFNRENAQPHVLTDSPQSALAQIRECLIDGTRYGTLTTQRVTSIPDIELTHGETDDHFLEAARQWLEEHHKLFETSVKLAASGESNAVID